MRDISAKTQAEVLSQQKKELAELYQKALNKEEKRVDELRTNALGKMGRATTFIVENI